MQKIYIIEDDENIRDLIKIALEGYGYETAAFETAEEALLEMEKSVPDLAIFDVMLPGMDGLEAIKQIRKNEKLKYIPILVLTAKGREYDKVLGLDGGADDYMTKPFGVMELSARIRSLLRRSQPREEVVDSLVIADLTINKDTREVRKKNELIDLTFKEYELMFYLIDNHKKVVSREELLNKVWGYEYDVETRTLDIHIRNLRQKIGEDFIKTVRGVGYRFVMPKDVDID